MRIAKIINNTDSMYSFEIVNPFYWLARYNKTVLFMNSYSEFMLE